MIVERVNAGLARAKAAGVRTGRGNRKDGKPSSDEHRWGKSRMQLEAEIRQLRANGTGMLKIARTLGIGASMVQRVLGAEGNDNG
jgi:DNA invertase Pin-like site-specific DNA recombinase